jgi:hypothetical protein
MLIPATNMKHPHTQYFEVHDELLLPPLKVVPRARVHLTELSVTAANSRPLYSQHPPAPCETRNPPPTAGITCWFACSIKYGAVS